ncbi:unnamed protein product [Adineta steineri]|uniref:Uncharacterized protein n=1 Tax=Adineta steineri TaxID=433720 RepID=A0A814W5S1_9BILA|nr:unnamed protein product [Adineta steineri]CAF1197045.1 unnamed protein product [Adineta steineri]
MAIKRKDFQKTSSTILEFLLKLPDEEINSRLRDTLLHGLHFLQQYYLILQKRDKEQKPLQWTLERGLSPLTPFREAPDKFEWPWIDIESHKVKQTIPKHSLTNFLNLSPIIIAVREGDLRYVKELLNSDTELIDCVDSFGRDLLTYAVQYQQIHILRYLLLECKSSININFQANDGSTCLHRACYTDEGQQCNIEIVKILLENNADVTKQDVHLRSPLHWAVLAENIDCLKLLIEYNIDVHIKDIDGMTAAMWACHLDRFEHFIELSQHMNDSIETDNDGRTWIHHSVRKTEPLKCLKYLLSSESILLRDNDGKTCLHVAAEQGSVQSCRLIFDMSEQTNNHSYIHDGDKSQQTPLHLATKHGHARVLKELLDHGADPDLNDIQGISSFDYAQNRGLYFCRSVFEVYLREKNSNNINSRPSTTRSFNNNIMKLNGNDVTPTPPVNGHATFIRRNGHRSLNESLPIKNSSTSPILSTEKFSHTITHFNSSSNGFNDNEEEEDHNQQQFRPVSSTTNNSLLAPPIKPRKNITTPNNSIIKPKINPNHHFIPANSSHSDEEDDDDGGNSLQGHNSEDDNSNRQHEQSNSHRFLRHNDNRFQQQQQSNTTFHRPHYKKSKQSNKNLAYDDYRPFDEQQQQPSAFTSVSKQPIRSAISKDFLQPSLNRIGSSNGNQSISNRLKSGSKSSSTESIPALDLTVAGQKVFRTKQSISDIFVSNSLPNSNQMRPPSGRLKPIHSAKSTSSVTDEYSSNSTKTLEDVTNNSKQSLNKAFLHKKKLTPLINGTDTMNKKSSLHTAMDHPQYVEDITSDRSEETSIDMSTGGGGDSRDFKSFNRIDKHSKLH